MLSGLNLLSQIPVDIVIRVENDHLNKTGSYLTQEEWSVWFDLNRTVISCQINGVPCQFEFYFDLKRFGCYEVKPKYTIGNFKDFFCVWKKHINKK